MHFYDLRHQATSRLFEKGLNPVEVATITRYKNTDTLCAFKCRGFGGGDWAIHLQQRLNSITDRSSQKSYHYKSGNITQRQVVLNHHRYSPSRIPTTVPPLQQWSGSEFDWSRYLQGSLLRRVSAPTTGRSRPLPDESLA